MPRVLVAFAILSGCVGMLPAQPPNAPSIVRVPQKGVTPKIESSVKLSGSEFELLAVQGYTGPVTWDATTADGSPLPIKLFELAAKSPIIGVRVGTVEPDIHIAPEFPSVAVFRTGTGKATLAVWGVKDGKPSKLATFLVDAGLGPQPPPDPKPVPPDPKPDVDPVEPVTSFRVIWIHESGHTLSQAQKSTMDAKVVRDYLNENCTKDGPQPGWRQWDRNIDASNDFPAMRTFWDNVIAKLKTTPAVAIEVNGKAEIYPFPASPADAIKLFKSKGGK
jgi:hypothetical protein